MTNIDNLKNSLPVGTDCAMITSGINRRYFTGMKSSAGTLLVFKKAAYLMIDFRYYEKAESAVKDCGVIKSTGKYYAQIKELLSSHGAKTVSIESGGMTVSELNESRKGLRGFKIDSTGALSDTITKLRSVKTEDETLKISKAQKIAEKSYEEVLEVVDYGMTEKELAYMLNDRMLRNGADGTAFDTIVLFGANTSVPHGEPSGKKLEKGDFILADFGAVFEGYCSDMTRTVSFGKPSRKMKDVYGIVLEAQSIALKAFKSGVPAKSIDALARDFIAGKGYGDNFGHGLGHSLGLEIHEDPSCNSRDGTILEKGMIMTCEPGIYLPGEFGVRIEDMVVISDNGAVNLTSAPKNI